MTDVPNAKDVQAADLRAEIEALLLRRKVDFMRTQRDALHIECSGHMATIRDLIEALQEARTQISLLQSMRGIVDTGHGTLSIIDAALAKAGVTVEMEDAGQ